MSRAYFGRRKTARCAAGLTASVAAAACALAAFAQDGGDQGGTLGEVTLSQRAVWEDGDKGFSGETVLSGSFRTVTRSQGISLSFGTSIEERFSDGDDIRLTQPSATLSYFRDGPDSRLTADLSYRETDLADAQTTDDDGEILVLDSGTRADSAASLGYSFGIESKFGGDLRLGYRKREYQDATAPTLFDSDTRNADLNLHFQLNPLIRASLFASHSETDGKGAAATDSRIQSFGGGASFQIDKVTSADLQISRKTTRRESETQTSETRGLAYALSVKREQPAGNWSVTYDSSPGTQGRRETLSFARDLEMPRYKLGISAGVSRLDGGDLDPLFSLSYQRDLPNEDSLSVALTRRSLTDVDGNEALNTTLSARFAHAFAEGMSVNLGAAYRKSEIVAGEGNDAERISIDLGLRRDLTKDWGLVGGYSGVKSKSATKDETDHKLYLGLETSYQWRP